MILLYRLLPNKVLDEENSLYYCDPKQNTNPDKRFISVTTCFQFRGDIQDSEIVKSLENASSDLRLSVIAPNGYSSYVWNEPWISFDNIIAPKQAVHMLDNSTKLSFNFQKYAQNYDKAHSWRAFAQWPLGEALETGEMGERREDIAALIADYRDVWDEEGYRAFDIADGEGEGEEE